MTRGDESNTRDAGFDEWLDAIEEGIGYYLICENGHGSLPPKRICLDCGSTDLGERPLPDSGSLETYTVVHVPTPRFADDAPYITAIVDFEDIRMTGVLRGVDPESVVPGLEVEPTIEHTQTAEERVLVFRPRT